MLFSLLLWPALALAKEQMVIAGDDASQSAYSSGWKSDSGGSGFGGWTFQSASSGDKSYAGFFIATQEQNPEMKNAAIQGKAFGLFANGSSFEIASAFRPLNKPLGVGESFSFLLGNGKIEKKGDTDDPATGSIGITLRTGNESGGVDAYNKGARFEFGYYEGQGNYQVYDGEENHDTGVAVTDAGLSVSLTLVTADSYDLEITTLADKKTTKLSGRKLGGTAGGAIDSFCIFNRDGEKSDAFFNGFQVSKESDK